MDLGGLEAGDGRDLLSSSKHDCRCVCVNNDESVLVFGRVFFPPPLFFFFLTFDQPKKSLSIEFFFVSDNKNLSKTDEREKKRERDRAF